MKLAGTALLLACASGSSLLAAQVLGSLAATPNQARQFVAYTAEPQTVAAGRQAVLELHFRVLNGFHINSHVPRSELLIPTKLDFKPADGVRAAAADYPAGKPYSFSFDPATKLDVYADDFTVRLPVTAVVGMHELSGVLQYQACDKALCYPPRSLPVSILFSAK